MVQKKTQLFVVSNFSFIVEISRRNKNLHIDLSRIRLFPHKLEIKIILKIEELSDDFFFFAVTKF